MVTNFDPIGDPCRGQHIPGSCGSRPLGCIQNIIHVVAQADDIGDIEGGLVVNHPLHLGVVDGRIRGGIILWIGDRDQREVCPNAAFRAAIERDGLAVEICIRDIHGQGGRGGNHRSLRQPVCGYESGRVIDDGGDTAPQLYPVPVIVPLTEVPALDAAVLPEVSFNPQRATNPLCGLVMGEFSVPWISACVRA